MLQTDCVPVVEITRGNIPESIHYGAVAVVSVDGKLLASVGNPDTVTYLRSSAKPFQVLPFLAAGGAQHFNLSKEEIALMCGSHSGTDAHVQVAASILSKIGVSESDLHCGTHPPMDESTYRRMILQNQSPTPLRHNCSGKHSGFLAFATLLGESLDDYLNPEHPVQKQILENFAAFCELSPDQVEMGIDGCSAPVFAVPLRNAALAIARVSDSRFAPPKMQSACQAVIGAMQTHPNMVAGPGRFDTRLIQAGENRWISKIGAEGYQIVGILPGVLSPESPGIGITVKTSDGDLNRHVMPTVVKDQNEGPTPGNPGGRSGALVTLEVLRQLGILTPEMQTALQDFDRRTVQNWRKLVVGEIRPCFTLDR